MPGRERERPDMLVMHVTRLFRASPTYPRHFAAYDGQVVSPPRRHDPRRQSGTRGGSGADVTAARRSVRSVHDGECYGARSP